jgi:hypothetical protein
MQGMLIMEQERQTRAQVLSKLGWVLSSSFVATTARHLRLVEP